MRDADVAFALTPWNFDNDEDKILWAMQSLKGDPKEQWHNERAWAPVVASSWEYFTNFLLDKVEDPVNSIRSSLMLSNDLPSPWLPLMPTSLVSRHSCRHSLKVSVPPPS